MVGFAIAISGMTLLYAVLKYKRKINPLLVFSVLWFIIFILASMQLYNLKPADDLTYFVMGVGILFWSIGYIFSYNRVHFKSISNYDNKQGSKQTNYKCKYNVIYFLIIITLFFYLKDLLTIILYIDSERLLAQIRQLAQDSGSVLYVGRSKIETAIRMLITQPFLVALQPIVAVEFWFKTNESKRLLILDFVLVFLRMFTDGSRAMVMYFGLHLLIVYILLPHKKIGTIVDSYRNRIAISKKAKRKIYFLVIALAVVYIISSFSRSGSYIWKHLYLYFSMEPYMMSYWIGEIQGYGYGAASLNGLVYPIIYVMKNLLNISEYPAYWFNNIFLLINDTDQKWQTITTSGTPANAYISLFWFPYLDGGIIGEIIIMFIYGFAAGYLYKKAIRKLDMRSIALFSLLMQGIIMSFVRFQFASANYALAFVFLLLFFYKRIYVREQLEHT